MRIDEALSPLGVPVCMPPYQNDGDVDKFIIFDMVNESGELYTDDMEDATVILWAVDLFTRGDWRADKPTIKRLLTEAGYIVTSIGQSSYEADTRYHHLPFTVLEARDGQI